MVLERDFYLSTVVVLYEMKSNNTFNTSLDGAVRVL